MLYDLLYKSVLSRIDPEVIHDVCVQAIEVTSRVPLVRDAKSTPKSPTLSDLNRETMQKAAEAEAAAAAEAEKAAEAETVATAEAASASTAGRKYRTETTRTGHTHTVADPNAPLSSLAASPEAAERAAAREDAVEDTPRFLKLIADLPKNIPALIAWFPPGTHFADSTVIGLVMQSLDNSLTTYLTTGPGGRRRR